MTVFTAHKFAEATVGHSRAAVWELLVDPRRVARMTPMVHSIRATGERWAWRLVSVPVLDRFVDLSFTEAMTFDSRSRIGFRHDPAGAERAGVDGWYELADSDGGTHLSIDVVVHVELPFPGLARFAVQGAMQAVLAAMGAGFARAVERELR